jgi:Tfp pilus assembly protein PilV
MEVLISIFVLSVGMLGVAALIPIGRYTLVETGKADRAGACGRAAMRIVKNTRILEGYNFYNRSIPWYDNTCYSWYLNGFSTSNVYAYDSFCLDPLGCTRGEYNTALRRFPSTNVNLNDTSSQFAMPRISLATPGGSPTRISLEVAQRMFSWPDDRLFEVSVDDRGQRARQMLLFDNDLVAPLPRISAKDPMIANGATAVVAESEGAYSWMATICPHYWEVSGVGGATFDQLAYNVSIVVFFRRNFSLPNLDDAVPSERVATVNQSSMNSLRVGVGGGRILLQVLQRTPDNRRWLDVDNGQWIMLAGRVSRPRAMSIFRWYRVASAGEVFLASGYYQRYVTLDGPDWPQTDISQTRAVIVTGVVGVYTVPMEKERSGGVWDVR